MSGSRPPGTALVGHSGETAEQANLALEVNALKHKVENLSQQVIASVDQSQPKVVQMSAVTAPSSAPPAVGLKAPTASAHDDVEQHLKLFAGERPYKLPY